MKAALLLLMLTGSALAGEQEQRQARQAEIAYYTTDYDGADISISRFHCQLPSVPPRPVVAGDSEALMRALAAWHACYQRFLDNYHAALPVGRSIPADLADLMTDAELRAAQALMSEVFVRMAEEARRQVDVVALVEAAWDGKQGDIALGARASPHLPETAARR
jgi:hypothetical protein